MKLSIVIVVFNDAGLFPTCIDSIEHSQPKIDYSVFLIDNASSDNTPEIMMTRYPEVTYIRNKTNLGFGKANNIGISATDSDYVLILNPDTIISRGDLELLVSKMEEEIDIAIISPKLVKPNGEMDLACRRMIPNEFDFLLWILGLLGKNKRNPKFGHYNLTHVDPDIELNVEAVAGAFMLVRRSAIAEVGVFDEDFFIYGEDLDWCYRFVLAGWKVRYYPKVEVIHIKGGTSSRFSSKLIFHFYRSNALFIKKHFPKRSSGVTIYFLLSLLWLKFFVAYATNLIKLSDEKRVA